LKVVVLFLFLTLVLNTTQAQSIEVSGAVRGVWNVDTVKVVGNIELRAADTLFIDKGVTVMFWGQYHFSVYGSLKAIGDAMHPVVFTVHDTLGFHVDTVPAGGWNQIRVEGISPQVDSVIFDYCHFEYGKAVDADSVHGYGGALCIRNTGRVSVSNSSFVNNYAFYNGGAIYLENASIKVFNNRFLSNRCGQATTYFGYGGAVCSDESVAEIRHNHFQLNSSTGIGGGLCVRFSDGPVSHNIFEENYSALGGGFGMLHIDTCFYTISNNLVTHNSSLFFGGGISNGDCSPTYINNTIVENHCAGGGGGFYCKDSVVPVLINNILYGNTQYGGEINQVYLWDFLSQPDFYYNNIQGGKEAFDGTGGADFSGLYLNNINSDPQFLPATFELSESSLCVNAGNPDTSGLFVPTRDLEGFFRIVADTIDIGAYEQQFSAGVNDFGIEAPSELWLYPNPVVGNLRINFMQIGSGHVSLFVTNMHGVLLEVLMDKNMNSGTHQVTWNASEVTPGLYHVVLQVDNATFARRVVVSHP